MVGVNVRREELNPLRAEHVRANEEVEEEDGEDGVQRKTEAGRRVADVHRQTEELPLEALVVDEEAGEHLQHLKGGDGQVDPFGNVEAHCLQCVVAVHDAAKRLKRKFQ